MPGFNAETIEKLGEIERKCCEMREIGVDVASDKAGSIRRLRAILREISQAADETERELRGET